MRAIILAAGRGSRLQSLTRNQPKCLVPFEGKPLVQWQLEALRGGGINQISIVCGYQAEKLKFLQLPTFLNDRWAETQMAASLATAASWLKEDSCVVSYSDIFYYADTVAKLVETQSQLAIAYDPNWLTLWRKRFVEPLSDAETFRIDQDRNVLEIGRRPTRLEDVQGQYMGLLRFTPESWLTADTLRRKLPPGIQDRLQMTAWIQLLIESGYPVVGVPISSRWGEIDSLTDLSSQTL